MTCRDLTDFLADYVADELPVATRETFEGHLARCPNCRVFVAQYRHTIVLERLALSSDADPELPEDLVRAIMKALDDA